MTIRWLWVVVGLGAGCAPFKSEADRCRRLSGLTTNAVERAIELNRCEQIAQRELMEQIHAEQQEKERAAIAERQAGQQAQVEAQKKERAHQEQVSKIRQQPSFPKLDQEIAASSSICTEQGGSETRAFSKIDGAIEHTCTLDDHVLYIAAVQEGTGKIFRVSVASERDPIGLYEQLVTAFGAPVNSQTKDGRTTKVWVRPDLSLSVVFASNAELNVVTLERVQDSSATQVVQP